MPYFADSCQKCGPKISDQKDKTLQSRDLSSSKDEKDSQSTENSKSSKFSWIISIGLALVFVAFLLNSNSEGGTGAKEDGENGYWVSKCRNITELNPEYSDSDISSITDNLNGPSRFITRRECTDVWVEN